MIDAEDLRHALSIWEAGYFRPRRVFLVLNEGVIRDGRTIAGAFEATLADGCRRTERQEKGGIACDLPPVWVRR